MPPDRNRTPSRPPVLEAVHGSSPGFGRSPTNITSPTTPVPVRDDESIACQRCRQRKKRCNRVRPSCEGCLRSKAPCVYEVVITDRSHPQYVPNLIAEMKRLKERCQELENRLTHLNESRISPQSQPDPSTFIPTPSAPPDTVVSGTSDLIERVIVRILTKEQDPGTSLRGTIGRQLGAVVLDEQANTSSTDPQCPLWPPLPLARTLVDYFFDLSFGTMRFVHRRVIDADLEAVYGSSPVAPDPRTFETPDIRIFRLCLLFTAVSERLVDDTSTLFRLRPIELYRLAIAHLPAAFRMDQMTCLVCINMLCLISLHQFVTISPYETVSIGAAMALEMGLNHEDTTLPVAVQEERRRVFWTLFCADRAVATYTVKPLAIPEAIISIRLPEQDIGGMITDTTTISPSKFFRCIVMLRRLHGIMLERIYLAEQVKDPESLLVDLRNQIDDWFADTLPVASGDNDNPSPHPFFEVQYNLCLTNLYRPSRLSASTPPLRLPLLRTASARAITLYQDLLSRRRVARSYTHLYNIVVLGVSMLYALGEAEGDVRNLDISSWRLQGLRDIDAVQNLLVAYCTGWSGVSRYQETFATLAGSMRYRLSRPSHVNQPPAWARPADAPAHQDQQPVLHTADSSEWNNADFVFDSGAIDVEAFLSSVGLSDWTSGA